MKYSMKKMIYLVTLIGGNLIVIYGLITGVTIAVWIGLVLVLLSYLFEIILLRCSFCNKRIIGRGFWAGLPYVIRHMSIKECQNPECGKTLD